MTEGESLEADVWRWGARLSEQLPCTDGDVGPRRATHVKPRARRERRMMQAVIGDARLRAALFRFVDVRPACTNSAELVRHLHEYLDEADGSGTARRLSSLVGRRSLR